MTAARVEHDLTHPSIDGDADVLLTVEEVGRRLGTGERFARRLVSERRIQFVKVGRHVRIPTSAVRSFIEAATVNPVQAPRPRY